MKNNTLNLIIIFLVLVITSISIFAYNIDLAEIDKISKIIKQKEELSPFDEKKVDDIEYVKDRLEYMAEIEGLLRKKTMTHFDNQAYKIVMEQDAKNTDELKKILEKHLWITKSKFGIEAAEKAWLIVMHSPDINFQHKVLFIMENLYPSGEIPAKHYAYLYDRISLYYSHFGIKQKYGTQAELNNKNNQFYLSPFEGDLKDLNKRRTSLGLQIYDKNEIANALNSEEKEKRGQVFP